MRIGIIGAGNVGLALASAWSAKQQQVTLGVNDPSKYQSAVDGLGQPVGLDTVQAVIRDNDLIVLAVPFSATESIAASVSDWQGKVVVDATNPIAPMLSGLSVGTTDSGAERFAQKAHGAKVVKAFNTTGAENMANSHYAQGKAWMPVCGDDSAAKQQVMQLAELIGFQAVDLGALTSARYLEPFAMTWIHLALKMGKGRDFAFGILER